MQLTALKIPSTKKNSTQPINNKAPRLRCEDNVSLTLASVEAPPRNEGNGPSGEVATVRDIDILIDV